jgi:hypothetical protein
MGKSELLNYLDGLTRETLEKVLSLPQLRARLKELDINLSKLGDLKVNEIAIAGLPANLEDEPLLTKSLIQKQRGEATMPENENIKPEDANVANLDLGKFFELVDRLRTLSEDLPELSNLADQLEEVLNIPEDDQSQAQAELEQKATEKMRKEDMTRSQAYIEVSKEDPDLYERLRN